VTKYAFKQEYFHESDRVELQIKQKLNKVKNLVFQVFEKTWERIKAAEKFFWFIEQ
jgi:hypothetical protein